MKESRRLNQKNLALLPPEIARPTYDRSQVTAGIVHIGVGGFHRSHQAFYTDQLMNETGVTDWGICGVGVREADRKIGDILRRQDYLYSLLIRHPDGHVETRVIGSIVDFMLSPDDPAAVIARMAAPTTRIVSLTITEGGYNFNPATGEFDFNQPDVRHDLAHPAKPRTVFGLLTAALRRRREADEIAFTVQSCDNIQHNGDMTRRVLLAFAHRQDPALAAWIEDHVRFPNAMVDRITPVTTPADIKYLDTTYNLQDEWPVTCEPFIQWVIEDRFSAGRPAWEQVGAQFVPDVTPYEKMKIRLLNAGHSVLGLLGSLHGHPTIDACMADPLFATYLRRFMDFEATPVLDPVPGVDLDGYKDCLVERFGNPNIKDNLARICLESSSKLPKFLLPTITENLARGGSIEYATLVVAAWDVYSDRGTDRHGTPLDIVDDMKDELHRAAARRDDPLAFLQLESVFGDLSRQPTFTKLYRTMRDALRANPDTAKSMQALLFGQE